MVDLVKFLRESVKVQDSTGITEVDPAYLDLTDVQLGDILQIMIYKESPTDTLISLKPEKVYPVLLLAKKELYHRLSVKEAPLYPVSLEGGTSVRKNIRFDHYLELIKQVQDEYNIYLTTGVAVVVGEITTDSRYHSARNYNVTKLPSLTLNCDNRYADKLEISWTDISVTKFGNLKLYVSTDVILDKYNNNEVSPTATLVAQIVDIHNNTYRLTDLQSGTNYHVALVLSEMNGVKGCVENIYATM